MQMLRSLFAWMPRDAFSRLSLQRALALFLLVVVPGALLVPICCGIYGAIRQTLAGKVAASSVDSGLPAMPESTPR